ncbi:MAG: hypothetical protein VKK07_03015 [Merismopediaceae bacterium]|nr:hypothetical protein [Merismopediaceae bacterium]
MPPFSRVSLLLICACGLLWADSFGGNRQARANAMIVATLPPMQTVTPPKPAPTEIDPLDTSFFPPDPLIPNSVPLSSFQRRRLTQALDQLHQQGQELSQQGQDEAAFTVWYRELRGRRSLGTLAEIDALGRVGGIAWEKSRKEDVLRIQKRLEVVKQEEQSRAPLTPEVLTALATAYQRMRSLDEAIAVHQGLAANARQQKNLKAEEQALGVLGELYLAKFDYPNAAIIYEDLLARAQARKNAYLEGIYLQKLARIYQQAAEPENAVRIKEQLVQRHIKDQKLDLVADLKIALGDDYEKLKQSEKASQNYQSAYSIAWSLQQFGAAGLALKKLANLYQTYQQPNYALQIYQKLLRVEQQSYNYYGLMKTYEQIAQLYRTAKQYDPALVAYQQALALARSLQYTEQETYFLNQIQAVYGEKNPQPGREN